MKNAVLLIFLREPILGKVKTRLAADIGDEAALNVYNELLTHTLTVARSVPWIRQLWYSDQPTRTSVEWELFEIHEQEGDDLGARMSHAFARAFDEGRGPAVLIGTDCPGLRAEHLHQAMDALGTCDVVIGPASDGGYYLIGLREPQPELFEGIAWSTSTVLEDTIRICDTLQLHTKRLTTLGDVDVKDDLHLLRS